MFASAARRAGASMVWLPMPPRKDFFLAIGEQYDWSFSAMEAESAGSALSDLIPEDVILQLLHRRCE